MDMHFVFFWGRGLIPGWPQVRPQVRVAVSCLRVATAGGHYSRFAHHAIDTAQAHRPEGFQLRFAPTETIRARTHGGTGGLKATPPSPTPSTAARPYRWRQPMAKSSPASDRSQHSKSNPHRAFPAGELYPSPGRYRRGIPRVATPRASILLRGLSHPFGSLSASCDQSPCHQSPTAPSWGRG